MFLQVKKIYFKFKYRNQLFYYQSRNVFDLFIVTVYFVTLIFLLAKLKRHEKKDSHRCYFSWVQIRIFFSYWTISQMSQQVSRVARGLDHTSPVFASWFSMECTFFPLCRVREKDLRFGAHCKPLENCSPNSSFWSGWQWPVIFPVEVLYFRAYFGSHCPLTYTRYKYVTPRKSRYQANWQSTIPK